MPMAKKKAKKAKKAKKTVKKAKNFLDKDQKASLVKEAKTMDLKPTYASDKKAARVLTKKLGFKVTDNNVKAVRYALGKVSYWKKNGKAKKWAKKAKKSPYFGSKAQLKNLEDARKARKAKEGKVVTVNDAKKAIANLRNGGVSSNRLADLTRDVKVIDRKVNVIYKALGL